MPTQVIQLSDFHLNADPTTLYQGKPAITILADIVKLIQKRFPETEYLVLTGDLAHDEKPETYKQLRNLLGEFIPRCYLLPGNHDNRAAMENAFPENIQPHTPLTCFSISVADWRLIGLDSHVQGELYGRLDRDQLCWLDRELKEHENRLTILFVHHPPVPIGSPWLDAIGLKESEHLADVLSGFSHVRAICTGHIHQEFEGSYVDDIKIYGAPSTSVQFRPKTLEHETDPISPGFRLLEFHGESLRSQVIRLTDDAS